MIQPHRLLLLLSLPAWAGGVQPGALVEAASAQIGITKIYDSRYLRIPYPGGDVPMDRGVCTDVVIRAYRKFGTDLQRLVHEDMVKAPSAYPNSWHQKSTDTNIDHRRVPNLEVFFSRKGLVLANSKHAKDYLPGDIVTWRLTMGSPHIGIISATKSPQGIPMVIHNIGNGACLDDILFVFKIMGHYRYYPQ